MIALISRLLDWRREMLFAVVSAMETCWLYPWIAYVLAFIAGPQYRLSVLSVFLLLWAGSTVMRVLDNLDQSLRREQVIMVVSGLVATILMIRWNLYAEYAPLSLRWIGALLKDTTNVWLALPPQLLFFFAGLLVWARGIRLGQDTLGAVGVGGRFRMGIVGFMVYLVVAALSREESHLGLMLGLFLSGLLAIALARINELGWSRGGVRTPFTPSWFGIVLGSALLVVALGALASAIFSLDNVQSLFDALRPVMAPLRRALSYVFLVLVSFIVLAGEWLTRLLQALLGDVQTEIPPLADLGELQQELDSQLQDAQFWGVVKISRDLMLVVFVVAAILAVYFVVQRRRMRRLRERDITRESVWDTDDLLDDLAGMLRGGWQSLRDGAAAGWDRLFGERYSMASIRSIYASLVRLAEDRGIRMHAAQTPFEFAHILGQAWPHHVADIQVLTESYVRAHYGEELDTEDNLRRAAEAWQRLAAARPAGALRPVPGD